MITLKAVSLSLLIDKTPILRNVNLEVNRGEILGLVGPLGCGKTTLLKLLGRLKKPTSGQIYLNDHPLVNPSSQVAYVWQKSNLMPWRTVYQNVALPLEIRGVSQSNIKTEVTRVLRLVGLNEVASFYPHSLSGGMEQLTALARAFVSRAQILLLDEPFSSLDTLTREKMNQELLRLWHRYKPTIILVTHNLEEAIYLSHRIIIMGQSLGRIKSRLEVPFPYPRNMAIKSTKTFTYLLQKVINTMG